MNLQRAKDQARRVESVSNHRFQKELLRDHALHLVAFPQELGSTVTKNDTVIWELMHKLEFNGIKMMDGEEMKIEQWCHIVRSFYHFSDQEIETHQDLLNTNKDFVMDGVNIYTPKLAIQNPLKVRSEAFESHANARMDELSKKLMEARAQKRDEMNHALFSGNLVMNNRWKQRQWLEKQAKDVVVMVAKEAGVAWRFIKACVIQNTWKPFTDAVKESDCNNVTKEGK